MTATKETVEIPVSEYEYLLKCAIKVKAVKEAYAEYQMRRKLVCAKVTEDHLHRLRRRTLSHIGEIVRRKNP